MDGSPKFSPLSFNMANENANISNVKANDVLLGSAPFNSGYKNELRDLRLTIDYLQE